MRDKPIATPSRTREILRKYGLDAKKSLGQNFLTDVSVLNQMLDAGGIDNQTVVIEIGPGIGALTEQLVEVAKKVYAFEIDQRFIPVLEEELSDYSNLEVIHQDILTVELQEVIPEIKHHSGERIVVVANLPYYITTPVIMRLIASSIPFDCMVLMMQKEVAERMAAGPNTKAYGSLSIAVMNHCQQDIALIVPRTVFNPAPNVDSAVLCLTRRSEPLVKVDNEEAFQTFVKATFQHRRKTLWNNLMSVFGKDKTVKSKLSAILEQLGIDPKRRPESLTISEFGHLYEATSSLRDCSEKTN
ncbi:MAG: 16S rRNA (adenine(1518)-N(6)/adenine(1519)-N(6))-dimethyltransferase RsmA [Bavariicoccus seileri]|uniref:16S rRNA (adenine(1518)-N(6)/adenine(1519)-N(6))- dimethyltransferase RsmA n=1 Tax=Bavariicoccus seileri TaxID=549685 RepID=UPI003F9B0EB7